MLDHDKLESFINAAADKIFDDGPDKLVENLAFCRKLLTKHVGATGTSLLMTALLAAFKKRLAGLAVAHTFVKDSERCRGCENFEECLTGAEENETNKSKLH